MITDFSNFDSLRGMIDYLLASNLFSFLFCIIIVGYMIFSLGAQEGSHTRQEFLKFMLFVVFCLSADMLTYVFDMQTFPGARILNHVFMFLSVLLTAFVGTKWLMFFDVIFHIQGYKTQRLVIYSIPTVITAIILVINLFTGYIFTIGADNIYQRGDGYWLSFILQYISYFLIILRASVPTLDVRTIRRKRMRNAVLWLSVLTLVFGFLQAFMGGVIATHCYGITVGSFIMFIKFQDDQITIDSLTSLNNRYALDTYLAEKLKEYSSGHKKNNTLYFLMMDLNKFKHINDTYGHQEGDRMLRDVAHRLKIIGSDYNSSLFLARYAGDEFAAVFETANPDAVITLVESIKASISEVYIDDFRLGIGIGYAAYSGESMSQDTLIELADKTLYMDKMGV